MNRKIIHIEIEPSPDSKTFLYALCDDGSVWMLEYDFVDKKCTWNKFCPDIPQD